MISKILKRTKVRRRIRGKISGTAQRPRLSVFRSNKEIYAQLIDDLNAVTLVSASSRDNLTDEKLTKSELANLVGKKVAERAVEAGISNVVFDRGGYPYHGRVKALAEGAREGGLQF